MVVPVVSDASGVAPVGLSVLIVGVVMTPLTSVGVAPVPGTMVLVVLVVVGVASGPQAASRSVPITRNDAMPVNLFFSLFRYDISDKSSLGNCDVVQGACANMFDENSVFVARFGPHGDARHVV